MTIRWRGFLAFQASETSDHRILETIVWRDLPLTLRIQTEDFGAHDGASPVGNIDLIESATPERVAEISEALGVTVPEGSQPMYGEGAFSDSEAGQLAAQWVGERVLRGVSVDPGALEYVEELVDPATGAEVQMEQIYEAWDQIEAASILGDEAEEARLYEWLESLYYRVRFTLYEIAAATLVATPAFGQALIEIWDDAAQEAPAPDAGQQPAPAAAASVASAGERLAALGGRPPARQRLSALIRTEGSEQVAAFSPGRMIAAAGARRFDPSIRPVAESAEEGSARQAAASRLAVATFPPSVFQREALEGPTKFTIEPDGRYHGHLFTWESCHRSFAGRCESPVFLRSDPDFRDFHVGEARLDDGQALRVGVLTFAALHAPEARQLSAAELTRLMEDTGSQLGPCRLHVDEFGLQATGQLWADVDPTQAARALAGFPSYDARRVNGRWRLFGLHVVNTPGHTIYEEEDGEVIRMVASLAPTVGPLAAAALAGDHHGCGGACGGSEGSCGCSKPRLSPAALASLAHLDSAMASRKALARR